MAVRVLQFESPDALTTFAGAAKEVTNAAIVAGGNGYEVDDILTVVGGGFEVAATLKVTSETGKVIDGIAVEFEGAYTTDPTNPVSVTGGSGNDDATFNLTLAAIFAAASDIVDIRQKDGRWYLFYEV